MKLIVQWTTDPEREYIVLDSSQWDTLPRKDAPDPGRTPRFDRHNELPEVVGFDNDTDPIDTQEGWLFDLVVQGIQFAGSDHYAVEDLHGVVRIPETDPKGNLTPKQVDGTGGIRVTIWNDDPMDIDTGDFFASVWTILPLAPDARVGGAINTRQYRTVYAGERLYNALQYPMQNTEVLPWSDFREPPPRKTRHGIWVTDRLAKAHEAKKPIKEVDWKAWTEGLAPEELNADGHLKGQRAQGRYERPKGTKTFWLYDNVQASGVHVADFEVDADETDLNTPTGLSADVAINSAELTHLWTTVSGKPNSADWPSGTYRCSLDVQTVMNIDGGYGLLTVGSANGHFANVNSGLTADNQTTTQSEAAFTGTGIKVATKSWDPAAGSASDRFELLVASYNTSTSMTGNIVIRADDSDTFGDGPWSATTLVEVTKTADARLEVTQDVTKASDARMSVPDLQITRDSDARILQTIEFAFGTTSDARMRGTVERSKESNAELSVSDVPITVEILIAADARLQALQELSRNADARVQNIVELTKGSDASLLTEEAFTLNADARVQATVDATKSADASLLAEQEFTKAADADIFASQEVQKGSSARLQATLGRFITADARIQDTFDISRGADARLRATVDASKGSDATLQQTEELSRGSDARLQASLEATKGSSARIQATTDLSRTSDARLLAEQELTKAADAHIQVLVELARAADARIRATVDLTKTSDAQITVPGIVTETVLKNADATIQVMVELLRTATARIQALIEVTRGADARLQALVETTKAATARLLATQEDLRSSDARVLTGQEEQKGADARILGTEDLTRGSNARLQAIVELSRASAARLENLVELSRTADARLQTVVELSRSADAQVLASQEFSRSAGARIQALLELSKTSDAQLSITGTEAFTKNSDSRLLALTQFSKGSSAQIGAAGASPDIFVTSQRLLGLAA